MHWTDDPRLVTVHCMNTTRLGKTSICLPMTAMFLTWALPPPLAAQKQLTFRGSLQGKEIDIPQGTPPVILSVDGTVTGIATHLGKFTYKYQVTVNLATGSGTGFGQLVAANGDIIFFTIAGQGHETDIPGLASIVEINTISGGTGRFAGVKGSLIIERLVDLNTGLTSGSFRGTMTSVGAAR
jgi:hypothetical protein